MYDLSGLRAGQMQRVKDDWKLLVDRMRDRQGRQGSGLLAPQRQASGRRLGHRLQRWPPIHAWRNAENWSTFSSSDKQYGGFTVMLGVPTGWRTLDRDSVADERLHDIILAARHHQPVDRGPLRFAEIRRAPRRTAMEAGHRVVQSTWERVPAGGRFPVLAGTT